MHMHAPRAPSTEGAGPHNHHIAPMANVAACLQHLIGYSVRPLPAIERAGKAGTNTRQVPKRLGLTDMGVSNSSSTPTPMVVWLARAPMVPEGTRLIE